MEPIRLYQPGDGEFIPGTTVRDRSDCYACRQYCQIYRRALNNVPAMAMIAIYRIDPLNYVSLSDALRSMQVSHRSALQGGYNTLSHYWELIEQMPGERADGSNRVGWWRLTNLGRRFVLGEATVAKYAHIYNEERLWFSGTLLWSIHDALGVRFNYDELMGGG